jgi:hypothetical protein
MSKWGFTTIACALALSLGACQKKHVAYQPWEPPASHLAPEEESTSESKLIEKVEDVAILPFQDISRNPEHTLSFHDLQLFGEKFASHLVGSTTFKGIMYPSTALAQLEGTDLNINRDDDLKEIGNILDVDAIVFGVIHHYNMYYPPRLSISMKFYLTRAQRFATVNEISAMAHAGVPINSYNPTFFKQLWDKSAYYDGSSTHLRKTLSHYLKTHQTSRYGFEEERFLRTKRDFIDLIAYDLSNSLNQAKTEEESKFIAAPLKGKKKSYSASGYYHR